MTLKAIQTFYCGYYFRSRLEARWATFFDYLLIPWEYEKEGYDLGDGLWYLPDFWLPQQNCWIEIKGDSPTAEEELKCRLLAQQSGKEVLLFAGPIRIQEDTPENYYFAQVDGGMDWNYLWCECPECGKIGIEFEARAGRQCGHSEWKHTPYSPKIIAAYQAAIRARFENHR